MKQEFTANINNAEKEGDLEKLEQLSKGAEAMGMGDVAEQAQQAISNLKLAEEEMKGFSTPAENEIGNMDGNTGEIQAGVDEKSQEAEAVVSSAENQIGELSAEESAPAENVEAQPVSVEESASEQPVESAPVESTEQGEESTSENEEVSIDNQESVSEEAAVNEGVEEQVSEESLDQNQESSVESQGSLEKIRAEFAEAETVLKQKDAEVLKLVQEVSKKEQQLREREQNGVVSADDPQKVELENLRQEMVAERIKLGSLNTKLKTSIAEKLIQNDSEFEKDAEDYRNQEIVLREERDNLESGEKTQEIFNRNLKKISEKMEEIDAKYYGGNIKQSMFINTKPSRFNGLHYASQNLDGLYSKQPHFSREDYEKYKNLMQEYNQHPDLKELQELKEKKQEISLEMDNKLKSFIKEHVEKYENSLGESSVPAMPTSFALRDVITDKI